MSNGIHIQIPSLEELPPGTEIIVSRKHSPGSTPSSQLQQGGQSQPLASGAPQPNPRLATDRPALTKPGPSAIAARVSQVGRKAKKLGLKHKKLFALAAIACAVGFHSEIAQGAKKVAPLFGVGVSHQQPDAPSPASSEKPAAKSGGDLPPVPQTPSSQSVDSGSKGLPAVSVPGNVPERSGKEGSAISKLKEFILGSKEPPPEKLYFPLANATYEDNIRISSRVGAVRPLGCNPRREKCREHKGDDLVVKRGIMKAVAVADGHVTRQSEWPAYRLGFLNPNSRVGGVISLSFELDGTKYIARYVHLDPHMLKRFREGQPIEAGEILSTITMVHPGSSGAHLHFEVYFWDETKKKWMLHRQPTEIFKEAEKRSA